MCFLILKPRQVVGYGILYSLPISDFYVKVLGVEESIELDEP